MYFDIDDEGLEHQDIFNAVSRELFAVTLNFESAYGLRSVPTHTEDGIPIRKIYVSNLPPKTTRTELFGLFAQYGFIKSCWLRMGDKGPNKSPAPTYAFITFSNPADAHKALQAPFHEKQLRGRNLRISPADSWHQPAEESDGRVNWRPYGPFDQRFEDMNASPSGYEEFRHPEMYPRGSHAGLSGHVEAMETNHYHLPNGHYVQQPVVQDVDYNELYSILDVLNVDCMNHIFSFISLRDLIRSERVSKRWQALVQEFVLSIRIFKTSWWQHVPITMTTAVLRRLLQRVGASLTRLHIDHSWSALNDRTAHTIGKFCPYLEELKIVGMHTRNWNPLIYGCKNLKKLSFISCNKLNDSSLIHIVKSNTPIERLIIANNTHVTGLFLTGASNRRLTSLSFYNCYSLQGPILSTALDTLPRITTLRLDVCPITIWSIMPLILKKLPRLLELSLSEYTSMEICLNRYVTEEFCEALSLLKDLKVINFSRNIFITNSVVKQIARTCSMLESLNISSCNATNNVLPGNYPSKGVSDDGLTAVCRHCPKINNLDVSYLASVTDDGLSQASRLENLKTLTSRGISAISSQPFALCLASCHILREIDVCGCDSVSEEIVVAAVRALEVHPRKLVLMLAGTAAAAAEYYPEHRLLTVDTVEDLCNPHLRPEFRDHIFDDSSDESFDDFYDNDDLDWMHPDDDDVLFDDELENFDGIYRLGLQPQNLMLFRDPPNHIVAQDMMI